MNIQDIQLMHKLLREECIRLRTCYNTFYALFDSGDNVEELLRKSAGQFFTELNVIYIEYYILQVARITDPAKSNGKDNLTINSLNDALRSAGKLTPEIEGLTASINSYRTRIVDARNKRISHLDKSVSVCGTLLGDHAKAEMEQFIDDIQAYMDAVGNLLGTGPLDFRCLPCEGDVQDLIRVLERGQK